MKNILILIQKNFDLKNPNTTFKEIVEETEYIKETFVHEYKDLFTCLVFLN